MKNIKDHKAHHSHDMKPWYCFWKNPFRTLTKQSADWGSFKIRLSKDLLKSLYLFIYFMVKFSAWINLRTGNINHFKIHSELGKVYYTSVIIYVCLAEMAINWWVLAQHLQRWGSLNGHNHCKSLFKYIPSFNRYKTITTRSRGQLRLITGHCGLSVFAQYRSSSWWN